MSRKFQLLLALFAAFLLSQSIALGAPKTAKWDPTFGSGGTVKLPRYGSSQNQSVSACTRSASGRIGVVGSFGKSVFPPSRSAAASVSASGVVGKVGGGSVWARTKFIKFEGELTPLSDGSLLHERPTPGRTGSRTITRLNSRGRLDNRFGTRGELRFRAAEEVGIFPLDDGEFLVVSRQNATTSIRRFSRAGKPILRFGGASGVQFPGSVGGAATFSNSGSIVLITYRSARSPEFGIELISADGQLDSNFIATGVAGIPQFDKTAAVSQPRVYKGRIFVLVSTHDAPVNAFRTQIAQLNGRGELVSVSGIVDTDFYGDGGDPSEFDRSLWATPRGVVYARTEQWSGFSTKVRYSLWRTPLSERPVFDRQIKSKRQTKKTSPYFIAEHSVLSADSRYLIACGSSALAERDGERRRNVALRRLKL